MIIQQLTEQLAVLKDLLLILNDQQYTQKIDFLNNASIGSHSRHIIELIQCLTNGYSNGTVDYINRDRNLHIEQDRTVAISELASIAILIKQTDKYIQLLTETQSNDNTLFIGTTYLREIEYNKEHSIHHLALIRIALREMNLPIVNDSFGVAHSTLKYIKNQQVMQS
jgi:hypothetical protein